MSYLLDTNVISELVKQTPNQQVLNWMESIDNEKLYLSVITIGEIRKGIAGIQNPERLKQISHWLEIELPAFFEHRILNIDVQIADRWGRLQNQNKGITLPAIDGLIAATACVHDLRLVTRNTKDFINASISLLNPWEN
jgi:toxin FitB